MTSKEAMAKLKENFENDVYKVEREMLNIINHDLVISEILKEYVYFDTKDNLIKMRTIGKHRVKFKGHKNTFNKALCWICYNIPSLQKLMWM